MDYIREFDIRLGKEYFYAGEVLSGEVILDTTENFKVRAIRVLLRGKAHSEWKVMVSGDRRTVSDDQYFIDDRAVIWGKEKAEGNVPILTRGLHHFPFKFQLPESQLPCSYEAKCATIRYYLKVTVDVPYASPPQGMKYFTIVGPHLDCMDYLRPIRGESKRRRCCLCCESGRVSLKTDVERSAYVCGEALRVKADIDNQSDEEVRLKLRLIQYVEYYIERPVLGVEKELSHVILEYRGAPVSPHTRTRWDAQQNLVVPTLPPTLVGVCRLIQIYYVLKVNVELEKSGEDLHMHFPITIATVPFRIPNSKQQPIITYEVACDHCEGGMYIGPEFLLGQVYDGTSEFGESIVLYRPVYPTVKTNKSTSAVNNSSQPQSLASTPSATKGLKVDVPKVLSSLRPASAKPSTSSTNNTNGTSSNLITSAGAGKTVTIVPTHGKSSNSSSTSESLGKKGAETPGVTDVAATTSAKKSQSKRLQKTASSTSTGSASIGSSSVILESSGTANVVKKSRTSSLSSRSEGKSLKDGENESIPLASSVAAASDATTTAAKNFPGEEKTAGSGDDAKKKDEEAETQASCKNKGVVLPGRVVKLDATTKP